MDRSVNFTNYYDHPEDNRYLVFRFQQETWRSEFERLVTEANVPFDKMEEVDEHAREWTYYGIHKDYKAQAFKANNMTSARFRQKFIPNVWFRWTVVLIGVLATLFGILSAIMNDL